MKKKSEGSKEFDRDREFAVVLENIHSDVKIIAEGQKALDEKFTGKFNMLFEEFGRQKEDIFFIRMDIGKLAEGQKVLDEKFIGQIKSLDERVTGQIRTLDGKITTLDEKFTGKFDIVIKEISDVKTLLQGHDTRLIKLEEACAK